MFKSNKLHLNHGRLVQSIFGLEFYVVLSTMHEISNNVVCTTSKASDQPAHTRSLIRASASRLSIL